MTVDGPAPATASSSSATARPTSRTPRPINEEEVAACEGNGIEFTELAVGIDGLTVATNPNNADVECLDVPALYALVGPESEGIDNWSGQRAGRRGRLRLHGLPDADLVISGPGESPAPTTASSSSPSPTWPKSAAGRATRADYNSSPNDNGIVQGIEGSDTSLGWLGFAYYEAEKDR